MGIFSTVLCNGVQRQRVLRRNYEVISWKSQDEEKMSLRSWAHLRGGNGYYHLIAAALGEREKNGPLTRLTCRRGGHDLIAVQPGSPPMLFSFNLREAKYPEIQNVRRGASRASLKASMRDHEISST